VRPRRVTGRGRGEGQHLLGQRPPAQELDQGRSQGRPARAGVQAGHESATRTPTLCHRLLDEALGLMRPHPRSSGASSIRPQAQSRRARASAANRGPRQRPHGQLVAILSTCSVSEAAATATAQIGWRVGLHSGTTRRGQAARAAHLAWRPRKAGALLPRPCLGQRPGLARRLSKRACANP